MFNNTEKQAFEINPMATEHDMKKQFNKEQDKLGSSATIPDKNTTANGKSC